MKIKRTVYPAQVTRPPSPPLHLVLIALQYLGLLCHDREGTLLDQGRVVDHLRVTDIVCSPLSGLLVICKLLMMMISTGIVPMVAMA